MKEIEFHCDRLKLLNSTATEIRFSLQPSSILFECTPLVLYVAANYKVMQVLQIFGIPERHHFLSSNETGAAFC
jgi:hypothetical protein